MILAGKGTKHARESLLALAEHIGAPIVLTLPAKGIIPDEHPLCIGGLGLIGTKPSYEAMKHADTLIMVGTSYPFTGFLPEKQNNSYRYRSCPNRETLCDRYWFSW